MKNKKVIINDLYNNILNISEAKINIYKKLLYYTLKYIKYGVI